ncbi:MAG: hypothetical protein K1X35_09915 [Caulobacteraceae bacterium]|nr:hypothetical protein [Caulobacteraceae bacterium]
MPLTLPRAPQAYDPGNEQALRGLLEAADRDSLKRGRDLDLGAASAGLILVSANGSRWRLTIADDGALTTESA